MTLVRIKYINFLKRKIFSIRAKLVEYIIFMTHLGIFSHVILYPYTKANMCIGRVALVQK